MRDNQRMRTNPDERLVGRDPVLASLHAGAEPAAGGRVVLVTGEPGIGKTALLSALVARARESGTLVLWAQCWDGDGAPAYWPWVQVLRGGIDAGGDPGVAAMVLPERASDDPDSPADRFLLFEAVVNLLARLAARRPVLLAMDDLQWADDGSVRLLEFAARHLAAHPVALVGAYRDEEADDALRHLAAMAERVPLAGLSREDVAAVMTAMSGAQPPAAVAADVWRRTGGNPFLVRELTRLLLAHGGYGKRLTSPPELLDRVNDILERRLARLSAPCVELLTLAAAIGHRARLDVLLRVAPEPDRVPALLTEAVTARVMVDPDGGAGPYRFSHDLFRETLLAGLPADRRVTIELATGRALESLLAEGASVHPAELAAHFTAAASIAPDEAVRYDVLAAEDATARLAFEEARDHYERALAAVAPLTDRAQTRLRLLLSLGDARNRAGDAESAFAALAEAADIARRHHDSASLAEAALGIHRLGWRTVHAEAIAALTEAVAELPHEPSVLRAKVLAALARERHHAMGDEQDWERASALAAEAVDIARQSGDPGTVAFCLLAQHDTRWRSGSARDRLPVIEDMLLAASDAGDRDMVAQARQLRAAALIELGDPDGVSELDVYCGLCDELGHARARYAALTRRATAAVVTGDLDRAGELATHGLDLGRAIGEQDARGVYETLWWGIVRAGGPARRVDLEPDARLDSDPWPGLPLLDAVNHVVEGDLASAGRDLARLDLDDLPNKYDLEMLTFVADATAAAGTADQRTRVYELLLSYAGSHIVVGGCASYYGAVDHYLGILAAALGRTDDADRHFAAAAELHDKLGAPGWAAHSRSLAAEQAQRAVVFRRDGDVWTVGYGGTESHVPDAKGLRDLAVLLARPGEPVHAVQLHTGKPPQSGADDVLDDRAKAAYRRRLAELDTEIDDADLANDVYRAEKAAAERDALIAELSAAVGLGGRSRRLGDDRERARKAVTARIRDAIDRIERSNPALGTHLRASVRTGTWCSYEPDQPPRRGR
ncbi:MAG: AAA family ATPase [Actinophytocola sp.]|nr:AAA family ATPase [Actinophytocola sp.]